MLAKSSPVSETLSPDRNTWSRVPPREVQLQHRKTCESCPNKQAVSELCPQSPAQPQQQQQGPVGAAVSCFPAFPALLSSQAASRAALSSSDSGASAPHCPGTGVPQAAQRVWEGLCCHLEPRLLNPSWEEKLWACSGVGLSVSGIFSTAGLAFTWGEMSMTAELSPYNLFTSMFWDDCGV